MNVEASIKRAVACAECVARARELTPLIESAADRIETEREIPDDVLAALHEARLFRMLIPRSCDGEELTPMAFFEAIEAIAMADASVAWCLGQGSGVLDGGCLSEAGGRSRHLRRRPGGGGLGLVRP